MCIVVMGLSGFGKFMVGVVFVEWFGVCFVDGDDLYLFINVEKMVVGILLDDDDRMLWLCVVGVIFCGEDCIVVVCFVLC